MININAAKTHLSEYTRRVKKGERFILCDRNKPFAEIRPLALTPEQRRPFGLSREKSTCPRDSTNRIRKSKPCLTPVIDPCPAYQDTAHTS